MNNYKDKVLWKYSLPDHTPWRYLEVDLGRAAGDLHAQHWSVNPAVTLSKNIEIVLGEVGKLGKETLQGFVIVLGHLLWDVKRTPKHQNSAEKQEFCTGGATGPYPHADTQSTRLQETQCAFLYPCGYCIISLHLQSMLCKVHFDL